MQQQRERMDVMKLFRWVMTWIWVSLFSDFGMCRTSFSCRIYSRLLCATPRDSSQACSGFVSTSQKVFLLDQLREAFYFGQKAFNLFIFSSIFFFSFFIILCIWWIGGLIFHWPELSETFIWKSIWCRTSRGLLSYKYLPKLKYMTAATMDFLHWFK